MIDDEGRLHLLVVPSDLACSVCKAPGSNLEWSLEGRSGVLCRKCLSAFVEEMNESLGANNTLDYTPMLGDISVQEVQPGWFNVYCFQGTWDYLTAFPKEETEELIRSMYLLGESQGVQGTRRYYRVKRECARESTSKPGGKTTRRQGSHRKRKGAKRNRSM